MRWITAVVLTCLLVSTPAFAVVSSVVTHTFQSAAAATGDGTALDVSKYNSLSVQITSTSGTFTVLFEGTIDNTNWVALAAPSVGSTSSTLVTSATAAGVYQFNTSGLSSVRMKISACSSCVGVTVKGVLTTAVASKKGGGSGSGAPTDAEYLMISANGTTSAEVVVLPTDDAVIVGNGTTYQVKVIPDCDNPTTGKLLYDQTTNAWSCGTDQDSGATTHNLLSSTHSDTVAASPVLGDMTVGNVSSLWTVLAGNTAASSKCLSQTGTGAASALPTWSATCTTNAAALTANLPVIGAGSNGIAVGTRSGNTTAFVTTTGTQTSGDCVKIDANGNHVANGSACGGSGTNSFMLALNSGAGVTYAIGSPAASDVWNVGVGSGMNTSISNVAGLCMPVPVTGTLRSVYYHIRVNGTTGTTGQNITHKIVNVTAATGTTGVALDWDANTNTTNETGLTFAITAGDCIAMELTMPGTWTTTATNVLARAGLYITVP